MVQEDIVFFFESFLLDKWRELYIQPSFQATIPDSQSQASSNKLNYRVVYSILRVVIVMKIK